MGGLRAHARRLARRLWKRTRDTILGPSVRAKGSASRSRGLARFDSNLGPGRLNDAISEAYARGSQPRLLEIGFGDGHLLLDLRNRYEALELHGINRVPRSWMRDAESLRKIALDAGLLRPDEARGRPLAHLHFYDAQQLHFGSSEIDVVVSQAAIPWVERKERLIEEVWRVLKPGGRALLNLDSLHPLHPEFMRFDAPRFQIFEGEKHVPLSEWIAGGGVEGLDLQIERRRGRRAEGFDRVNLVMRKNSERPLHLGLRFDSARSRDLWAETRRRRERCGVWGYYSVYQVER
jgi:SAM-dependent methyltransferase